MAKRNGPKKLSNPVSTSGEGDRFQARVQASYLLALLSGDDSRFGPCTQVAGLRFQARLDYQTDDLVCTVERDDASTFVVAIQIKLTIRARAGDSPFKDAITAAWHDFKSNAKFRHGVDRLAVAYSRDSGGNTVFAAQQVCERARNTSTPEDFLRAITAEGYGSDPLRDALAALKTIVEGEAGAVTDDELHRFCRHLWFLEHQLASDGTPEVATVLKEIRWALGRSGHGGPSAVWNTLVTSCQKLNAQAASLTRDNLRDHFDSARLVNDFARHRASDTGDEVIELAEPAGGRRIAEPNLHFASDRTRPSGPLVDSTELGAGRQDSANRLVTNQLEAVNSLIKAFRYKDAQEQLSVLGQDLGPFDDYQRSRWYLLRATCEWHTGSTADAARDFLKAAEVFTEDERNAAAKVRGLLLSDRAAEAVEAGKVARERFPESLFVWAAAANAQILSGEVPDEASLPPKHRNSADAFQLIAAGLHHAGRLEEAAAVSLRSLQADDPGFYVRAAALSHVLDVASQNNVHVAMRTLTPELQANLKTVTDAFEPRDVRLWDIQSDSAVSVVASNLGAAYLLQGRPEAALEVAREARTRLNVRPELVRVELEALHDTGQVPEMFRRGLDSLGDLQDGGLVALAQVAANQGDFAVADKVYLHAQARPDIDPAAKAVLRATRWLAMWNAKERATVAGELAAFEVESTDSVPLLAAVSRLALASDKDKSAAAVKRARELAGESPPAEVRLLLADLYSDLRQYPAAAKLYESVLPSQGLGELHARLLFCLIRSGNRRKAKDLLGRLPDGWTANDDLRALASELARDAGDWPLLSRLADAQFASNPCKVSSWLFKYMVSSRELPAAELKALVERAPLELEGTAQQTTQLSVLEFRLGLYTQGLRRLYRMRRLDAGKVETASALMMGVLAYNQPLPWMDETLPAVEAGTHFVLNGPAGISHITIDPEGISELTDDQEFHSPGAAAVKPFLGKAAGDEVELAGGFSGPRVFKVLSVGSAFRRLLALAQIQVETSLEPPPDLWTLKVGHREDGEPDFSELHENLKRQSQQIHASLKIYEEHPCTLGALSRMIGRDAVELVQGWATGLEASPLHVCEGNAEELQAAHDALTAESQRFLIDAPTLAELVQLDAVEALSALPEVYATTETAEILRLKVEELQDKGPEGRLLDDNGQMRFVEFTPKSKELARQQARAAVDALEKYCQVVPAYGPESRPEFFDHVERILSQEERAVLSAALERNLCLVSTDLRIRQMAAQMEVPGVWPQVLMQYALSKGVMTQQRYSQSVLRLLVSNRSFVPLTPEDLWVMCQQSAPWVRFGVARLKVYLAKPSVEFKSTFQMLRAFVAVAILRGMGPNALAELIRHLTEGIMRHKALEVQSGQELLETIYDAVTSRRFIPYGPIVEHGQMLNRAKFQLFGNAVSQGLDWAQGEAKERPVRLTVHFATKRPLIVYDAWDERAAQGASGLS